MMTGHKTEFESRLEEISKEFGSPLGERVPLEYYRVLSDFQDAVYDENCREIPIDNPFYGLYLLVAGLDHLNPPSQLALSSGIQAANRDLRGEGHLLFMRGAIFYDLSDPVMITHSVFVGIPWDGDEKNPPRFVLDQFLEKEVVRLHVHEGGKLNKMENPAKHDPESEGFAYFGSLDVSYTVGETPNTHRVYAALCPKEGKATEYYIKLLQVLRQRNVDCKDSDEQFEILRRALSSIKG